MQGCEDDFSVPSLRNRLSPTFDAPPDWKEESRPEFYIDVQLNKTTSSVRSFAQGGVPYYDATIQNGSPDKQIVDDIIAGKLSERVLSLFEGASEQQSITELICYVTDLRQALSVKFQMRLLPPQEKSTNDASFSVRRVHRISDSCPADALAAKGAIFDDKKRAKIHENPV